MRRKSTPVLTGVTVGVAALTCVARGFAAENGTPAPPPTMPVYLLAAPVQGGDNLDGLAKLFGTYIKNPDSQFRV